MGEFSVTSQFAEVLYDTYPSFVPTQALYLDLEGRQNGSEDILSLYWPRKSGADRFSWLRRTPDARLRLERFLTHLQEIDASNAKWVVVYSAGGEEPEERQRLIDLFENDPLPNWDWINLHFAVQKCQPIKASIRTNRNVWHCRDRSRVRYSLEALEWEFGINRPNSIRSHSNCYKDADGEPGEMEVLSLVQASIDGLTSEQENLTLRRYCEADVKNMFEIANTSERMIFSQKERRSRRRFHSLISLDRSNQ